MDHTITRDFDLLFDGVQMQATVEEEGDRKYYFLSGTGSSSEEDLYGSILTKKAQKQMKDKLQELAAKMSSQKSGLTAWLNHSYKIPEDTLGAFTSAKTTTRNENGEAFVDLDIRCRLVDFETNPRAEAAWKQVRDGIRHGWSIGAYFTDIEWLSDDPSSEDFWKFKVDGVNLLEISLVGIPANQRAWCHGMDDLESKVATIRGSLLAEARRSPDKAAQRFGLSQSIVEGPEEVRDKVLNQQIRSFVTRSLVHASGDGVADSASTAPITKDAEVVHTLTNGEDTATCEHAPTCDSYDAHVALCYTTAHGDPENQGEANRRLIKNDIQDEVRLVLCNHDKVCESYDSHMSLVDAPTLEAPPTPGKEQRGVDTPIRVGDVQVATPEERSDESDIANRLRNLKTYGEDSKSLIEQAATAIDILVKAAQVQRDLERPLETLDPNGGDDVSPIAFDAAKIAEAISHAANAVGHGLCVKDAKHVGRAIDCLAACISGVVDQPGPTGDPDNDPDSMSYQIKKLSPKDGDVIVLTVEDEDPAKVEQVAHYMKENFGERKFRILVTNKAMSMELAEAELAERAADLQEICTQIEGAQTELSSVTEQVVSTTSQLETGKTELEELNAKIAAAKAARIGRKSNVSQMITALSDSMVKPEHYYQSPGDQQVALSRMAARTEQASGRDLAG